MPRQRLILLYVVALACATGATAYGAVVLRLEPPGHGPLPALAAFAALVGIAECLLVRYRSGDEVDALTLVEAVLAPLVFAFAAPQAVAAVVVGQLGAAIARRNEPLKAAFNIAQWSLAAALGSVTVGFLADGTGVTARNVAALLTATVAMAVTNQLTVTTVLAMARPEPQPQPAERRVRVAPVLVPGWLPAFFLNAFFGLLYLLAYETHPAAVLLFALPLVILNRAYLGAASAAADRQRLVGLHRAARALTAPIDPTDAIGPFLREVAASFDARGVALVLRTEDGLAVHELTGGTEGTHALTVEPAGTPSLAAAVAAQPGAGHVVAGRDDPLTAALSAAGWHDCLYAPLMDDGRIVGALLVLDQLGVESDAAGQLAVLDALARETAGTLAKGRLLERILEERIEHLRLEEAAAAQRVVVEQLQHAVMPEQPTVAGAGLGICYEPSDPTSPTGGDLYDWQVLPNGDLHIVVVDVIGHGVAATKDALAVVHTLRVAAVDGTPLEDLVARADRLLGAQHPDLVATVVVARFSPLTGELRVASGGHPPALVVTAGGVVTQLVTTGGAIGWPGAGSDNVAAVTLGVGDALVLYTDGLVEARKDILEGMESLLRYAAELAPLEPERLATGLVERSLSGAERRDDSLALVLRRMPIVTPPSTARWRIDPERAAVPGVRHDLVAWAVSHGLAGIPDLALVATELLANAVRAARSSVTMSVSLGADSITVEVGDDGEGDPRLPDLGRSLPTGTSMHGRGLAIVRAIATDMSAMSTAEGSVVKCVLPAARTAVVPEARPLTR